MLLSAETVENVMLLGVYLDESLDWTYHKDELMSILFSRNKLSYGIR